MHTDVKIKPFWYSDVFVFPKLITIVTTLNAEGQVNAAPYSHIMQYDVMHKAPRIYLGFRNTSHTFQNIRDTGEFVINCPSASHLKDMMETARFHPEGVNELEHTSFTQIPSKRVKPPSIAECKQILECTVDKVVDLDASQGHVIANIVSLMVEEELVDMGREDRLRALDLPIGLGDERRTDYFYSRTDTIEKYILEDMPDSGDEVVALVTGMDWDDGAMKALRRVPAVMRRTVIRATEATAKEKGADSISAELYGEIAREAGMDDAVLQRFKSGG
jgi:flavin reductase (DIM6/NTAB) family NADH-FMN oxidoreductase RutF